MAPIAKGSPWGRPGPLPADGVVVRSDAEASDALEAARRESRPFPVLGLLGGDLCRTVGGASSGTRGTDSRFALLALGVAVALRRKRHARA